MAAPRCCAIAALFRRRCCAGKGIHLVKQDLVVGLEGDASGRVKTVQLKSGATLPADLVVVGTGAAPCLDLVKGQVELWETRPGGVLVDGALQTSAPGVYAVGDIAAFTPAFTGKRMRQEHVTNARHARSLGGAERIRWSLCRRACGVTCAAGPARGGAGRRGAGAGITGPGLSSLTRQRTSPSPVVRAG